MTRSRLLAGVAVLLLLGGAVWWWFSRGAAPSEVNARPNVPTATAREATLERTLHLTGRVGPVAGTQSKLSFAVPGTVRNIDVALGQHVAAGEPLAQLDSTSYAYAAEAARADAAAAAGNAAVSSVDRITVKLRVDTAELQRQRRLYAAGIVAARDVAAAEATVAADRADGATARDARVAASAQSISAAARAGGSAYDLSRTTLRAPSDGVVSAIYVQPGENVDTSTAAIALAPSDTRAATLDAAVGDIASISPGDLVRAKGGDATWNGRVSGVAAAVDQATGLAVVSVSGVPGTIAAGTPVNADVVLGHAQGLAIPVSAVVEDPQTGHKLVFVLTKNAAGDALFTSREVRLGLQNGDMVLVRSGLKAGELVAAQGAIELLAPPP